MSTKSNPDAPIIRVGTTDPRVLRYRLANAFTRVKGDDGQWKIVYVGAELEIDVVALQRLVEKAHDNKTRRSSDGPLTIYALGRQGAIKS